MNLSRRSALMGLSLSTLAALSACTGSGGGSGEITFQTWSLKNERFTPYFESLIAEFEKANPGTTIKWIDQPGEGYEEKILQQANSSELPDVINLPETFAYQLAQVGKLVDLRAADSAALDAYVDGAVDAYTYEGINGSYGYPWYLGTDLCWWNNEQLAQAGLGPETLPTTQDEYLTLAKDVAYATGGAVKLIATVPILGDLEAAGVPIFSDGEFIFNSDDAVAELQKYIDAYAAGAMPEEALNDDYAGNAKMFAQEKVAYTTGTASFITQLSNDAPNLLDKVTVTKRLVTPPLFVQGITVSAESKNPDLALSFAQYVTNNDNQIAFVKIAQGFVPGTIEGSDNPDSFTADISDPLMADAVKMAAEQMKEVKGTSVIQYTDDMKKYTGQQMALALKGEISAKEALDAATTYCNNNLSA